jgi:hypothetical protein
MSARQHPPWIVSVEHRCRGGRVLASRVQSPDRYVKVARCPDCTAEPECVPGPPPGYDAAIAYQHEPACPWYGQLARRRETADTAAPAANAPTFTLAIIQRQAGRGEDDGLAVPHDVPRDLLAALLADPPGCRFCHAQGRRLSPPPAWADAALVIEHERCGPYLDALAGRQLPGTEGGERA